MLRNLFFLLIIFLFAAPEAHARRFPQLEFPPAQDNKKEAEPAQGLSWDFGKVKEGLVLKHEFVLVNDTGRLLKIQGVNTSCGCTVSEVRNKILLPGESTSIDVQFKTAGYSGKIKQFIYVNTDSLDKPVIRYIISAEVVKETKP